MPDSFFIRSQVTSTGTTFAQTTINLGSFVDVLGQAVLTIHAVYPAYRNANNNQPYDMGLTSDTQFATWQLTTQSQTELVGLNDKSAIASGGIMQTFDGSSDIIFGSLLEDPGPQNFVNGMLIAVEDIYLGMDRTTSGGNECDVDVILECSVSKMSTSKAMALALSQQ